MDLLYTADQKMILLGSCILDYATQECAADTLAQANGMTACACVVSTFACTCGYERHF